jgi:hypothetical protein
MTHLGEEQLVQAYYGEDPQSRDHIKECAECRAAFERLSELLELVNGYPVPERNSAYGAEVWARLTRHLPLARPPSRWLRWWVLTPAFAAVLALVFWAGMITQQRQAGISATARERVLLMAISDHLERSQIVLTELVHADPGGRDLVHERERARDLVNENRLLRESAARVGDTRDAGLLDELERVLVDIANSPAVVPADDLEQIQRRIETEGLLFKVRITGTDAREKGQKL